MSQTAKVVEGLTFLRASRVLIRAAKEALVRKVECTMPVCYCPGGRARFHCLTSPLGPWMPTADHIERKMDGGTWALVNIRLGHRLCNFADYAKDGGISFDRYLAKACIEWWVGSSIS